MAAMVYLAIAPEGGAPTGEGCCGKRGASVPWVDVIIYRCNWWFPAALGCLGTLLFHDYQEVALGCAVLFKVRRARS